MTATAPLLVVTHEATRTGSVRVAIDLLAAAKPSLAVPLAIRSLTGGPLFDELTALADVDHHGLRPGAVLINSALAAGAVGDLDSPGPTIVYVHEADAALRALPDVALAALRRSDVTVLCVSGGSRHDLVALGVDAGRVTVLPPLVAPPDVDAGSVAAARSGLGLTGTDRLVVGCGEVSWRKGTDLFADVARRIGAVDGGRVVAAWIGRRPRGFARMIDADEALAPGRDVTWLGEVEAPHALLAAADALVLTSREDPQPLVPLEAAIVGTPTAAFDLGGASELGRAGAALVAAYPDTVALAAAVDRLLADAALAASTVDRARDRAAAHAPAVVVDQFLDVLRRVGADLVAGAAR